MIGAGDTIVALASARGRAGVSVIRVSGPEAQLLCTEMTGSLPAPRHAALRAIRGADDAVLDQALILFFQKNRSFTGEDVVEFHVHGSPAVVSAVLDRCMEFDGVRLAQPGEFTRRAFDAGNMNLLQAEALSELINADTEQQRKVAMRLLGAEASDTVQAWREALIEALALIEAVIDFSDEDIPQELNVQVAAALSVCIDDMAQHTRGRRTAECIRDGFEVAIVGKVNAGKSTLLNALAGRDAAITSEHAGTTRDVIEVRLDCEGFLVTLIDTAGLRETDDPVERIGIDRGLKRASDADIRLYLKSDPDERIETLAQSDLIFLGKSDLWGQDGLSGRTGEGLDKLMTEIAQRLSRLSAESVLFSSERHFQCLEQAEAALRAALRCIEQHDRGEEFVAAWIREAISHLEVLTGRVETEEVLGRIFSAFCIGK